MSRKLLLFSVLTAWGIAASAQSGQGPVKAPLGKAIDHTAANAAKNPQSEGLGNANAQQTRNQERFIAKHIDGRVSGPERVERVERVERAERPERVERVERPERVERVERVERPSRPERADRPERPGKGR